MDLTEGSKTSAKLNLTPGKYPKENIHDFIIFITTFKTFKTIFRNEGVKDSRNYETFVLMDQQDKRDIE
jgi:hypothetical protein